MRIPSDAIIAQEKLTHYLLVRKLRNDKSRFLAQAGFTLENPEVLEAAIRQLITSTDALQDKTTEYGEFFRVEGDLVGPDGQLTVVTIWIVQTALDGLFRFVTLKPGKKPVQ